MAEPKSDDYGVSAVALDALERDFVEVMRELSAEDNLERFRLEYEKLHRALKKSHDSEKRLIKKCQELHQEIMENAAKVQAALRLSQDDENTIVSLRKEIERAWKMVDAAHEKESRAKDTIQMLKKEVNRLASLVERGSGLTEGQESNLQDLIEEKKEFTKERDILLQKVQQQTHELRELNDTVRRVQEDLARKETDLSAKQEAYTQIANEYNTEQMRRRTGDDKVAELHKLISERSKTLEDLRERQRRKVDDQDRLERFVKDEREKVHELGLRTDKMARDLQANTELMGRIDAQNAQHQAEKPRLRQALDQKEKQAAAAEKRLEWLRQAVDDQDTEQRALLDDKAALQAKTTGYEEAINELNDHLESQRRAVDEAERGVKDRVRDKNLGVTRAVKDEARRVALDGERGVELGKNRSLQQELDAHRAESQALRKQLYDLAKQRSAYQAAATEATERFNQALEDVKQGKRRVGDLELELKDADKKLKNQNSMYEQVLADRNQYAKNHNEAKEEIEELDRKFKVMDQQINQLKEELRKRETDLCEAHARHDTVVKEYKSADERVKHLENNLKEARGRGSQLAEEIKQLTQIIADCDTEKAKQRMKFNSVTNERNILATQLIRRNEELALLYEKIRVQQSTLLKGEAQYRDRLVDIGMLRKKAHELRTQLGTSKARIVYVDEMKRQITMLQRLLIQERTKVKALFEELQNPMNVHRWRKLEGSDPQEHENIQKLHTLQKRLIEKTEDSRQKDVVIQEKDRLYNELKAVLARQPGPEIAEQLTVFHENIVKREGQLSRMSDELSASKAQVDAHRQEMDRLQTELQDVKKKFFTLKGKNSLLVRERTLSAAPPREELAVQHPPTQQRFAGGGFCLNVTSALSQRGP